MNELQLTLTRLIGKKEKTLSSDFYESLWCSSSLTPDEGDYEITELPPTLSDLHRWMNEISPNWAQSKNEIEFFSRKISMVIPYDSYKDLLDQDSETLKQIIELIESNQPNPCNPQTK